MIFRSPWPDIEAADCSVVDEVLGGAGQHGERAAVIEGETGETLTYRALVERSSRVAAGLVKAGVRPGEPVAVALPNSIDFVLTWFGALRAGAWVVPVNPLYTPGEIEYQIRDSGARYLVAVPERAGALAGAVDRAFIAGCGENELVACTDELREVRCGPADMAVLPYSSGTTGRPKGVILTHANIVANIRQVLGTGALGEGDVVIDMMPLYHVAGLVVCINALLAGGGTAVLMRRFDLEKWLALSEQYRATSLMVPPPVVLAVTKSPLWDKYRLESIERAGCGAAPLGADLQKAFEERTGLVLRQVWGMTECTALISMDSMDGLRRRHGSCGHLAASSEARVVDVATQRELGANEIGEICLRGPNVMQGYWKQERATADCLECDGWLHTGDLGYFDADGYVYLVDRIKELIKYNALQVAPAELEDVIQTHPAVADAAVIGIPDEAAGEIPKAFVVVRAGAQIDGAELMAYVAQRVAPHKKVRAVEFIDQIPKSPSGKILRRVLRERSVTATA